MSKEELKPEEYHAACAIAYQLCGNVITEIGKNYEIAQKAAIEAMKWMKRRAESDEQ